MRLWTACLLACLAGAAAAQPALAPLGDLGDAASEEIVTVGLLAGWREPGGAHVAALEIRLAPGWHTYWRVPGAVGIPPQFDWSGSRNLASVDYQWPRPIPFKFYGVPALGYKEELVLPLRLSPRTPGAPIEVALDLLAGICKDICIPVEASLTERLEAGAPAEGRARIEAALADQPMAAAAAGVEAATCALEPGPEGNRIAAAVTFRRPPPPGLGAVIEAEAGSDLWIGEAETRTEGRRLRAWAPLEASGGGALALDRSRLRLTLLDASRAIDIRGCAGAR